MDINTIQRIYIQRIGGPAEPTTLVGQTKVYRWPNATCPLVKSLRRNKCHQRSNTNMTIANVAQSILTDLPQTMCTYQ